MEKKKNKIDEYLFRDNLERFFLTDMLRRKRYLENITIKQLDDLVNSIQTLISNLVFNIKNGKPIIEVTDKHNWENNGFFRDIILHNVLKFTNKDKYVNYIHQKNIIKLLKERWELEK